MYWRGGAWAWLRALWGKKKKVEKEKVDRHMYSDCYFLDWLPEGVCMLDRWTGLAKGKGAWALPPKRNLGGDCSSGRFQLDCGAGWAIAEDSGRVNQIKPNTIPNRSWLHWEIERPSPPGGIWTLAEHQLGEQLEHVDPSSSGSGHQPLTNALRTDEHLRAWTLAWKGGGRGEKQPC